MVPETQEQPYTVTSYNTVSEEVPYTVSVPVCVSKQVPTTVTKMVPQTVTQQVPVQTCGGCATSTCGSVSGAVITNGYSAGCSGCGAVAPAPVMINSVGGCCN